jgi:hypothetical protein
MVTDYQLLYHKILKLRAGESVKVGFGELLPVHKTHLRIDLESEAPKTFVFVLIQPSNAETIAIIRHVRADKSRTEFDFASGEDELEDFSELHISVPEDSVFHLGIYLKP